MKRIIAFCCVALLATACVDPIQPYSGPVVNKPEDGAPVTLEFSLPPMTKGTMTHEPTITTLHVAVFNQAGVLKQFEQATLTHPTDEVLTGVNANNPTYSVQVHMSATKRILHFIADSPVTTFEELAALAGTSGEDAVLNALTTSDGKAAYWQRVELDRIDAYTYQGGVYDIPGGGSYGTADGTSYSYRVNNQTITVNTGDFIKRDGTKVLDGTGYFQSDYVAAKVANIPLVRNFAEIKVTKKSGSNFTPVKFALVNVPYAGYVAPFDTKKGEFAAVYIDTESLTHSDVATTNYPGSLVDTLNTGRPDSFIPVSEAAYMYERTLPNTQQPATCILVAGEFSPLDGSIPNRDANGHTWFKIEISNTKNQYFPIYRGLSYQIEIGTIDGALGHASAEDAYQDYPLGDISNMTTTATLESINDGKGTTLWVEYIDYVATQAENKTLYYTMYYQPDATTPPEFLNDRVTLSVSHQYDESRAAIVGDVTVDPDTFNAGTPDDTKEWKKVTVPLSEVGQNTHYSTLTVTGTTPDDVGGRELRRDVTFEVMATRQFLSFTASPLNSEDKGALTELTIQLPGDLGFSMFPLELMIEPQDDHFASDGHYPVEYGPSLFSEVESNKFHFLVTIEYDNYLLRVQENGTATYRVSFRTTRDGTTEASNATTFAIRDKVKSGRTKPFFEKAECEATIGDADMFAFSKQTTTIEAEVRQVFFHTRTNMTGTWTLRCDDSDVQISPATGTGDQLITVTVPANTSTTEAKTYTITGSMTDGPRTPQIVITQKHVTVLKERTVEIDVDRYSFSGLYVYNGIYRHTIHMNFDGGYQRQEDYVALERTRVCGILVSAAHISKIVISWQNGYYRSEDSYVSHIDGTTEDLIDQGNTGWGEASTTWTGDADAVSIKFRTSQSYNFRIIHLSITYMYDDNQDPDIPDNPNP